MKKHVSNLSRPSLRKRAAAPLSSPQIEPKPKPAPRSTGSSATSPREILRELDLVQLDPGPDYFNRLHDRIMSRIDKIEQKNSDPSAPSKKCSTVNTEKVLTEHPVVN